MPSGTVLSLPDRRPRIVRSTFGAPVGRPAEISRWVSGLNRRRSRPATRFRRSSRGDARRSFMNRARTDPPGCDGEDRSATMSHPTDPIRVPVMTTRNGDDDVTRHDWLAEEFERHRGHLRAVAYRMLGSVSEAEDAVQEAWLRLDRSDPCGTDDLRGWLTVVVGRICLDALRRRKARREQLAGSWLPEPITCIAADQDPERDMVMADSVGLALLVVLESLTPPERLAFVLHDVFGVPFDTIAPLVERSPAATRQLASRARRRVRAEGPQPDADVP